MKKWAFAILVLALGGCAQTSPDVDPDESDVAGVEEAQVTHAGTPILAKTSELAVLLHGNFDTSNRLFWEDSTDTMLRGGKRFATPYKVSYKVGALLFTRVFAEGDMLGRPESFVKSLSGRISHQTTWARGPRVLGACASIPIGTAIGTFFGVGSAYKGHAGFLASCANGKIALWDQSHATPPDGLIRRHILQNTAAGDVADAASYYVILAPE
ncbi:MAG: hypothetical protein U0441_12130 [Polyangiaceae bacterium]